MKNPRDNSVTRRSLVRALGGVALTGTIAGCSGIDVRGRSSDPQTHSKTESLTPDSNPMSHESFVEAVESFASTYDTNGVWGLAEHEPDHGLEYVGAWTTSLSAERDDGTSAFTSDHALVFYESPDADLDSEALYRAWLWSAASTGTNSSHRLRSIRPSISLTRETDDMRHYSPASETTVETVPVELSRANRDGPVVEFPLHQGTVGYVGEQTAVGSAGEFTPSWSGEYGGVQSVNATCEMKWPESEDYDLDWGVRVDVTA